MVGQVDSACRQALETLPSPVSEYQLIGFCRTACAFAGLADQPPGLRLFQEHFLVMHVLYQQQADALVAGQLLNINPVEIFWSAVPGEASGTALSPLQAALAEYYLDLDHFSAATADSVAELLATFWRRFNGRSGHHAACQQLGVAANASWADIQLAYRKKAAQTHPDKGGDARAFIEVQQAYELLGETHRR